MVKSDLNKILDEGKSIIKNKKFQIGLTIVLFLVILYSSTSIRLSNLPNLVDQTTGLYTSNDLDSLYFYRMAETQLELGYLPEVDVLRAPGYNTGWVPEIIDNVLIWNYKILNFFNSDVSFNYASTISAPIIYGLLLIAFFALTYLLTKSKTASVVSSSLLAFAPAFLFRSIAGFYDHDHLGVLAVILFVLVLVFALRRFEKNWKETAIWGIVLGFFTALVFVSWAGAITFIFLFLPVVMFFYYLNANKDKEKFLGLYFLWILTSVLFTPLVGGSLSNIVGRFLDSQGLAVLGVLGFAIIDYLFVKFKKKFKFVKDKYEKFYSLGLTAILGFVGLTLIGKNPLEMVKKAWATLIFPFFGDFGGRLSATVAENNQPYLTSLISQNGQIIFWLFLFGLVMLVLEFSKNIENLKRKTLMSLSGLFLFVAILYSRYSSGSFLNGENFFSQTLYLIGALFFFGYFIYVYSIKKFEVEVETIILFALGITIVINARAAVRSFFLITPFICLVAGYFISEIFKKIDNSKKDKKRVWFSILIIGLLLAYISLFINFSPFAKDSNGNLALTKNPGSYYIVSAQAKQVGASANSQWLEAMAWTRNETSKDSIFVHWWDYGYFVQTLGERRSVTDGGHSGGQDGNHYIGRYILTTPNPETAYSFMKTWNVSYLLIDPTDLGKYGAFSKIGSNDSWDRISTGVVSGSSDQKNNQETANGVTRIYNVNTCVDGDINYNGTFLPGMTVSKTQQIQCKSYLAGIIVEMTLGDKSVSFKQPTGVFYYNNKRYDLPLKNLYFNEQMISFEKGIDSVVYVIPNILQKDGQYALDATGATMYLSPKVQQGLVGRLYVLDDYYEQYPDLNEAYFAQDQVVSYFNQAFGGNLGEFVYYQGLRAPLKIWSVDYPAGTKVHEEFVAGRSETPIFGGLDYLFE